MVFPAQHIASIAETQNGGFQQVGIWILLEKTSHLIWDFPSYEYWNKVTEECSSLRVFKIQKQLLESNHAQSGSMLRIQNKQDMVSNTYKTNISTHTFSYSIAFIFNYIVLFYFSLYSNVMINLNNSLKKVNSQSVKTLQGLSW